MQSDEERRLKNAAKQRAYRARKAAEREAAKPKGVGNAGDGKAATTMRDAVKSALAAMKWLTPSDDAAVAQAKMLAEDVDVLRFQGETSKALSAQRALTTVLNDLGGTPKVRLQHELRSLKLAKKTGDGDDGSEDTGHTANVTQFKRPPKRERRAYPVRMPDAAAVHAAAAGADA